MKTRPDPQSVTVPHTVIELRPNRMNLEAHPSVPGAKVLSLIMPNGVAYSIPLSEGAVKWLQGELNGGIVIPSSPLIVPNGKAN